MLPIDFAGIAKNLKEIAWYDLRISMVAKYLVIKTLCDAGTGFLNGWLAEVVEASVDDLDSDSDGYHPPRRTNGRQ